MHTQSLLQASASLAPFTLQVTCVCTYKIEVCICISMPISISLTHRHVHTWRPHAPAPYHSKPHTLPHNPSPPLMPLYTLPPSLSHSPKRRELVKDARRQHADRVAVQVEAPGHETRRQSALTHSTITCPLCPSACSCMCPMHMRHTHACVHFASLSLSAYARTVNASAHVHVPPVMNTTWS